MIRRRIMTPCHDYTVQYDTIQYNTILYLKKVTHLAKGFSTTRPSMTKQMKIHTTKYIYNTC